MQQELDASEIVIIGVNQVGRSGGNDLMCEGRDLAWLQETTEQDVWGDWGIRYRDVAIVDASNRLVATFNLTDRAISSDPGNATRRANYDALKQLMLDAR